MTQSQFAKLVGVAPNTVARWERGEAGMRQTTRRLIDMLIEQHDSHRMEGGVRHLTNASRRQVEASAAVHDAIHERAAMALRVNAEISAQLVRSAENLRQRVARIDGVMDWLVRSDSEAPLRDDSLIARLNGLRAAVAASHALDADQKQDASDLLREIIADRAAKPGRRRPPAVRRVLVEAVGALLAHSAGLATLWNPLAPSLRD